MKGINIFLADGFEDIEALAVNDVLSRGGIHANLIAIGDDPFVTSSHGVTVGVDMFLSEIDVESQGTDLHDVMIFPGGMPGSKNLASCRELVRIMKEHYAAGGTVAAICAAPGLVLGQLDCWQGRNFTCFDGFEEELVAKGGIFSALPAVTDGQVITGRSAGHAVSFGLEILARLKGDAMVEDVRQKMYLNC